MQIMKKKSKNNAKLKNIIHNCVEEWQFCCKQVILYNRFWNAAAGTTDGGRLRCLSLTLRYLVDIIVNSIIEGQIPDILQEEWSISGQSTNSLMDHHHKI